MASCVSYVYTCAYSSFQDRRKMTWTWFSKFKSHWAKTFALVTWELVFIHFCSRDQTPIQEYVLEAYCFRDCSGVDILKGICRAAFLVMADIWKRIFFSWREENKWTVLYHIMVCYTTVTMNSSYAQHV